MADPDIRWQQRFDNYCRALEQLELFFEPPDLNLREQQGLVKAFEHTFELSCTTLHNLLRIRGNTAVMLGSRDAIREAFHAGLLSDGPVWMEMVRDRNLTSHVYNRSTAEAITGNISGNYLPAFQGLRQRLSALAAEASTALLRTLAAHPGVEQVWLYGSRAMGRERPGSDIDLSLEGPSLTHADLLQLLDAVDELLLAWRRTCNGWGSH